MEILTILSILSLSAATLTFLVLVFYLRRHPQPMKIMNIVWPLTALWSSALALAAFLTFGKSPAKSNAKEQMDMSGKEGMKMDGMNMDGMDMTTHTMPLVKPHSFAQKVTLSTFHCGAGCTLADIIGESLGTRALAFFGCSGIAWQWTLDYILALLIGVGFQYAAIRPMQPGLSNSQALTKAFKADFLSLTSWQIGMYAFIYLAFFVLLPQPPVHTDWTFWFMMQIAMCVGFLFSYPMNSFLIRRGIKSGM